MRWLLLGCAIAACASPSSPPIANQRAPESADYATLLRAIGGAEDLRQDQLAADYVARGPDAVLAAANVLVTGPAEGDAARGARFVLMSLEHERDFAFVERFAAAPTVETSCKVVEVIFLVGQSAQFMAADDAASVRTTFVPSFARRLVRMLDEPWPTCVTKGRETGYSHPHVTALEILDDMVNWSPDYDGSLARSWDTDGPAVIRTFKQWWAAHPR